MRKPMVSSESQAEPRDAERRSCGELANDPPRTICWRQLPPSIQGALGATDMAIGGVHDRSGKRFDNRLSPMRRLRRSPQRKTQLCCIFGVRFLPA